MQNNEFPASNNLDVCYGSMYSMYGIGQKQCSLICLGCPFGMSIPCQVVYFGVIVSKGYSNSYLTKSHK